MANTRHDSPLLNLPSDLLQPTSSNTNGSSIPSAGSAATELAVMNLLSKTCRTANAFFKPELNKRRAKQLLEYVLEGDEDNAVKIAKTNPSLFFIKATALDIAMDLEGNRRTIEDWSPYQAMFGTGDKYMLAAVKPYLDAYLQTLPNGKEIAAIQELEKFPNGFDYPPCTNEFINLINELAAAITNDDQLKIKWNNPTPATTELLNKLRKYYEPGRIETGYHFNMNDFIKTHEIFKQYYDAWNQMQLSFFNVKVIGFQQRFLTAANLQTVCMGFDKYINDQLPLDRSFNIIDREHENKTYTVVPFSSEITTCRLGEAFTVDASCEPFYLLNNSMPAFVLSLISKYVVQTQKCLQDLSAHHENRLSHHV